MKVAGISLWDIYAFEPRVKRNETVENNHNSGPPASNNSDCDNPIGEETAEGENRLQNTEWCSCGNCSPFLLLTNGCAVKKWQILVTDLWIIERTKKSQNV